MEDNLTIYPTETSKEGYKEMSIVIITASLIIRMHIARNQMTNNKYFDKL